MSLHQKKLTSRNLSPIQEIIVDYRHHGTVRDAITGLPWGVTVTPDVTSVNLLTLKLVLTGSDGYTASSHCTHGEPTPGL